MPIAKALNRNELMPNAILNKGMQHRKYYKKLTTGPKFAKQAE